MTATLTISQRLDAAMIRVRTLEDNALDALANSDTDRLSRIDSEMQTARSEIEEIRRQAEQAAGRWWQRVLYVFRPPR